MTALLSELGVRCFRCGNVGTKRRPLRWEGDRGASIVVHAWAPCDEARDPEYPELDALYGDDGIPVCGHRACSDMWPCPAPPDGWGVCVKCREAGPIAEDQPKYGEVAAAVIERDGVDETTMRYGATVLPVFAHALRCPKQDRDGSGRHLTARRIDASDEDPAQGKHATDEALADAVPSDGEGLRVEDLTALWEVSLRTAREIVKRLLDKDLLVSEDLPRTGGGKPPKAYWRAQ
jgi:hypothetical protein